MVLWRKHYLSDSLSQHFPSNFVFEAQVHMLEISGKSRKVLRSERWDKEASFREQKKTDY